MKNRTEQNKTKNAFSCDKTYLMFQVNTKKVYTRIFWSTSKKPFAKRYWHSSPTGLTGYDMISQSMQVYSFKNQCKQTATDDEFTQNVDTFFISFLPFLLSIFHISMIDFQINEIEPFENSGKIHFI